MIFGCDEFYSGCILLYSRRLESVLDIHILIIETFLVLKLLLFKLLFNSFVDFWKLLVGSYFDLQEKYRNLNGSQEKVMGRANLLKLPLMFGTRSYLLFLINTDIFFIYLVSFNHQSRSGKNINFYFPSRFRRNFEISLVFPVNF